MATFKKNKMFIVKYKKKMGGVKVMVERWKDYEKLRTCGGRRCTNIGGILWIFSGIFATLGVIVELADVNLGLSAQSWFLLAIVFSTLSISYWIGWAVCVYVDHKAFKK
jgi:hypothetical protein